MQRPGNSLIRPSYWGDLSGIEPGSTAWQAVIIPLNHRCNTMRTLAAQSLMNPTHLPPYRAKPTVLSPPEPTPTLASCIMVVQKHGLPMRGSLYSLCNNSHEDACEATPPPAAQARKRLARAALGRAGPPSAVSYRGSRCSSSPPPLSATAGGAKHVRWGGRTVSRASALPLGAPAAVVQIAGFGRGRSRS